MSDLASNRGVDGGPFDDDFAPLDAAGKAVLNALRADESAPDADLYRRLVSSSTGSHLYYPSSLPNDAPSSSMGGTTRGGAAADAVGSPFGSTGTTDPRSSPLEKAGNVQTLLPASSVEHEHSVPLPAFLAQELGSTRLSSLMGLLPEADLAWMSVDEKLFVWSYDSSSSLDPFHQKNRSTEDFCFFPVPSGQCVVSVGLVKPKKGVFKDIVNWCLVVTTPEEVILCALAWGGAGASDSTGFGHGQGTLRLIPTSYIIPTDSIPVLSVGGTASGRIFLGGYDGCLYEMVYDGIVDQVSSSYKRVSSLDHDMDAFYDGDEESSSFRSKGEDDSVSHRIMNVGKRAISSVLHGADHTSHHGQAAHRSRKCRKVNHTSQASLLTAVVPGIVSRAASAVFSSGKNSTGGGPIVSIKIDEERSCLYTLSSKGWICAFDVSLKTEGSSVSAEPKLAAVVDTPKSARVYIDSVSRGRMYPPSSSHSSTMANITFPGGGASAQAGLGGMDGARVVLKLADAELQRERNSGGSSQTSTKTGSGDVLKPVSIHVIPRRESKCLTLVAITGSGLRYYMSSLSPSLMNNAGNAPMGVSSGIRRGPSLAPGEKFYLCHIRAPPPVGKDGVINNGMTSYNSGEATNINNSGGIPPNMTTVSGRRGQRTSGSTVVKSYYGDGVMLLATESVAASTFPSSGNSRGSNNFYDSAGKSGAGTSRDIPGGNGDCIIGTALDAALRRVVSQDDNSNGISLSGFTGSSNRRGPENFRVATGGVTESYSLPIQSAGMDGESSVLPGGRVWDIAPSSSTESIMHTPLAELIYHSETPTDGELSVGLVPAYFPPSRIRERDTVVRRTNGTPSRGTENASSSLTVANSATPYKPANQEIGVFSTALTVASNVLLSRPLRYGLSPHRDSSSQGGMSVSDSGYSSPPLYRLSIRYGCNWGGFSSTASEVSNSSRIAGSSPLRSSSSHGSIEAIRAESKSARLSPWLLRPSVAPVNRFAIQHMLPCSMVLALNSGGLHYFNCTSVLSNLVSVLMTADTNIGKDENVTRFFQNYGYKESCAMCLTLVIGCGPARNLSSGEVQRRALQAALARAHIPSMVRTDSFSNQTAVMSSNNTTMPGHIQSPPSGYEFKPSSLSEAVTSLLSRLLRPIWHKPAVVVTEGRTIHRRGDIATPYRKYNTPAKVELLLDDVTLEEIRKPLYALQNFMRDVFKPAVATVPGVKVRDSDTMDIDEMTNLQGSGHWEQEYLITREMQSHRHQQSRLTAGSDSTTMSAKELDSIARLTEERHLHCLYRLLSRTTQLLNMISLLSRAQATPELPEVDWGLLHGIAYSQLVQTREGQGRIENLLNSLVSGSFQSESSPPSSTIASPQYNGQNGAELPSAEADRLAELLASQCYMYFSSGSRLTYLGFRSALAAKAYPTANTSRISLTNQASGYLRRAARHWYNAPLVTGRILHTEDMESYDKITKRAMEYGSPLARAAAVLMDLEDVGAVVDLCLATASNFGGRRQSESEFDVDMESGPGEGILSWERDLYHRHQQDVRSNKEKSMSNGTTPSVQSRSSGSRATRPIVSGADVTARDALRTCHAILFHHLTRLLSSSQNILAEKMLSVCAFSTDENFLHSLFRHLQNTNHEETLLRIDSPHLESWLHEKNTQADGSHFLLWRYYTVQKRCALAGEVMWKCASDSGNDVTLDERIECLTRANNSYTAALAQSTDEKSISYDSSRLAKHVNGLVLPATRDGIQRMLIQINETLEVASLQRRILHTVSSSSNHQDLDDSAFKKLTHSLIPVSDLYNEYSGPLCLYDVCLLIMQSCHCHEVQTIETLWKSILLEEILPIATRSEAIKRFLEHLKAGSLLEHESISLLESETHGVQSDCIFESGDWIPVLKARVANLGKELYGKGADYTFPLEFIVKTLEGLRRICDSTVSGSSRSKAHGVQSWPLQCLLDIGVSYTEIFGCYHSLSESEERETVGGMAAKNRVKNVSNIAEILKIWVTAASSSSRSWSSGMAMVLRDESSNEVLRGDAASMAQLASAVSSGGLGPRIDAYKASLEGLIGGHDAEEIEQLIRDLSETEEAIKKML